MRQDAEQARPCARSSASAGLPVLRLKYFTSAGRISETTLALSQWVVRRFYICAHANCVRSRRACLDREVSSNRHRVDWLEEGFKRIEEFRYSISDAVRLMF